MSSEMTPMRIPATSLTHDQMIVRSRKVRPIRIAVDARTLNRENPRGMGKCLQELVARMRGLRQVEWQFLADRPDLPFHLKEGTAAGVQIFERKGHRFHAWEQVGLPQRARALRADILHCPAMRAPWWQPIPTVITLHDAMPWLQRDEDWPEGWYRDRLLPSAFRKCAAMITVSEGSRRDILRFWPDLEHKLHVIPNGVGTSYLTASPAPLSPALQAIGVRRPYLLYVGGEIPRKRLDWALRILSRLDDDRVQLVICGTPASAQTGILEKVSPALRPRLCFAPFVDESDLPGLYMNAVAVLYPTTYEGFGLPALEAQAIGTPVLFSDVNGLAELKGPGAHVLPVDDLTAWVTVARNLVAERGETPRPHEIARVWARRFSWDVYAARTHDVYERVLMNSSFL